MKTSCPPDISSRPHSMTVERRMDASAEALYEAWTEKFDRWFAEPDELMMVPEVDRPFFFRNRRDWGSHPHYGRFIELEKDRLVVMTWVTGQGGTEGAETVIRVELNPENGGTRLRLTHSGFKDDKSRHGHEQAWLEGLEILDETLKSAPTR
ncbi:MAG: SRPBCC domain-containing protein [Armatimonadetes bacterium]|nr:SRPBCC domain-containing protein [Armatimonadota bacterium]